jgi:PPP family 3-phenylpropionic acid transporter
MSSQHWTHGLTLSPRSCMLVRFVLLFCVMYCGFGAVSPFLPAYLVFRGLTSEQIGFVLAASTAIRIIAGPIAARIADRRQALHVVLAIASGLAGAAALGLAVASGFATLALVLLLQAALLAPTTLLADALALGVASPRGAAPPKFEYGWVRGAGSAAFIVGAILSGQAVSAAGAPIAMVVQAASLVLAAAAALLVPEPYRSRGAHMAPPRRGLLELAAIADFRRVVLVAALILGSHAMHDSFAMIRWNEVGIDAATGGILWGEAVAAEVVVFLVVGPFLLHRVRPEAAMAGAAAAAILRWVAMAYVTDVVGFSLLQPLHGVTFALLHLSCMRVLAAIVPRGLAATAQAIYGTLGHGAASALLTLLSGWLYSRFGSAGFLVMAALAALSLPFIWALYQSRPGDASDVMA